MDSLHNYDSGDEAQERESPRARSKRDPPRQRRHDDSEARDDGDDVVEAPLPAAKPQSSAGRRDDADYANVGMELSEDSSSSATGPAKQPHQSPDRKSSGSQHKRPDEDGERRERRPASKERHHHRRHRDERRDRDRDRKTPERSSSKRTSHGDRDGSSERHRDSKSKRSDRDRDHHHRRRDDGRRHKDSSRRRSHSKERSSKHSRRDRSRSRSRSRSRDRATSSSRSGGGGGHKSAQSAYLTHKQERDACKAEQLRKMGIEYGVANASAGCDDNSLHLAAAYASQQAALRQPTSGGGGGPSQLQQYQQHPHTTTPPATAPMPRTQPLLAHSPRPAIPSLLSLGVVANPNAPGDATASGAKQPLLSLLGTPSLQPLLTAQQLAHLNQAASAAAAANAAAVAAAAAAAAVAASASATGASEAPGSLGSLTNFSTPSILASARYTEQAQKRKLLWGGKKTGVQPAAAAANGGEPGAATSASATSTGAVAQPLTNNKWEETRFSQDTDGRVASKFLRLMGMKDATPKAADVAAGAGAAGTSGGTPDTIAKQNELFSTMEHQYEVARQVTHTMRGMGLGFGSQPRQF